MAFPHIDLADLARMQRDWAALLPRGPGVAGHAAVHLTEEAGFAPNPGNLRMLTFLPPNLPAGAPLVVVLHGCTQDANGYDTATGWSALAARHGFALLYPEQARANNMNGCFNWFEPADTARGQGEAASIDAMVAHMLQAHRCDPARVMVTGLSAGGAMTAVMLATYPERFAAGAIIAGLPFGVAADTRQALTAMAHCPVLTEREWGDRVRAAAPPPRRRPRVAIWHGDADRTVSPGNAIESAKQWTDVHGLSERAGIEDRVDGVQRRSWRDAAGRVCVEMYAVPGLAHGTPITPRAAGDHGVGRAGRFVIDSQISSTWHIARSWGLVPAEAQADAGGAATLARSRGGPLTEILAGLSATGLSTTGLSTTGLPQGAGEGLQGLIRKLSGR